MTQFLIREFTDSTGHITQTLRKRAQTKLSLLWRQRVKNRQLIKLRSEQND